MNFCLRISVLQSAQASCGLTQLPTQWVLRTIFPGAKRYGHEVYHSPPTEAEIP